MDYRIISLELYIRLPDAHSLKDKRRVRQALTQRLQNRWHLSVLEAGSQEQWQTLELVVVKAAASESSAQNTGQALIDFVDELLLGEGELIDYHLEIL